MAFLKTEAEYNFVRAADVLIDDSRSYWIGGFTQITENIDIGYSDYISNDTSDSLVSGEIRVLKCRLYIKVFCVYVERLNILIPYQINLIMCFLKYNPSKFDKILQFHTFVCLQIHCNLQRII